MRAFAEVAIGNSRDNRVTDVLALTSLLSELPTDRTRLLDNLGRIRREVGPITPELSDALADRMNIRRGEVHEVTSFYSFLRVPIDVARVCTGPVCDCMWQGEAPADGVLAVACVGHCDLAPVRMQGDEIVGGVTHRTNSWLSEPDDPRDPPDLPPEEVLARLEASGLTGMGGAGFPTWRKWQAVRAEPAPRVATFVARSQRCSSRWRAAAGCRGSARRFRLSAAISGGRR